MTSPSWTSSLTALLKQRVITGFALITAQGAQSTAGCLATECEQGVSPSIQALIQSFYTSGVAPSTHILQGSKLQVIQQTDSYYVAISKQRQLGLIALNLPVGVLLVTFNRSTHPHTAFAAVSAACSQQGSGLCQCAPSSPAVCAVQPHPCVK